MTVTFSATFEFTSDAPVTLKGVSTASSMASCFRNAAKQLQKKYPSRKWQSVVVVIERKE